MAMIERLKSEMRKALEQFPLPDSPQEVSLSMLDRQLPLSFV
jgi:hypothetical protein